MASLKKAISDYCKSCTFDPTQPGTYLQQIEECTMTKCALHPVRPLTSDTIILQRRDRMAAKNEQTTSATVVAEDDEE